MQPILHRILLISLLLLLPLTLTGCRTLPDVSKFSDASQELRTRVSDSQNFSVQGLKDIGDVENSEKLAKLWEPRVETMKAVVDYSASLTALVNSGQNGAANAQQAITAVDGLISTVKDLHPAGSAGAAIFEGASQAIVKIWSVAAKEIAAKSLEKSISQADPVIQKIALAIAQDLVEMKTVLNDIKRESLASIHQKDEYLGGLVLIEGMQARRNSKSSEIAEALSEFDRIKVMVLKINDPATSIQGNLNKIKDLAVSLSANAFSDPVGIADLKGQAIPLATPGAVNQVKLTQLKELISSLSASVAINPSLLSQLKELDDLLEREKKQDYYANYLVESQKAEALLDGQIEIVKKAADLASAWGQSHTSLLNALHNNTAPSFTELTSLAKDLYTIAQNTKTSLDSIKETARKHKLEATKK